jgi:outer membrane protein OmpA-like peptidoglycan-associated protein
MKILIMGFVAFVIWSVFSSWLYVDKILPSMKRQVAVQTVPEPKMSEPDSPVVTSEPVPKDLMIYFEFDKDQFKPDPQLDNSITDYKSWLEKHSASTLSVTGHTDQKGTSQYNQALGLKRAQSIRKYLEEKGISSSRITAD